MDIISMSIGELARRTDVKVPTIRFYEQIGLLPPPVRTANSRRVYDRTAMKRLSFVKASRQLGFTTDAIRTLLELSDDPETDCGRANALAAEQLLTVQAKIAQLEGLREELQRLAEVGCRGRAADCRVIEALSDTTS